MNRILPVLVLFVCTAAVPAFAHSDVGDRTFSSTMQFEDPSVGDELTLPQITRFKGSDGEEPARYGTEYEVEIERRLTENWELMLGGSYQHGDDVAGGTQKSRGDAGFDNFTIGTKYQVYESDAYESVITLGLEAELGDSGNNNVGDNYSVITPGVYFGKGMNELPYAFKPLAFTGGLGVELPTDDHDGEEHNPAQLETSFSIQYSLPYLQQQGTELSPFVAGLTPIVEFHYERPFGSECVTGTVNPGVLWMNDEMQIGLEAVLPGAAHSGQGIGFTAQLHFFLDELAPSAFGKPLFGS